MITIPLICNTIPFCSLQVQRKNKTAKKTKEKTNPSNRWKRKLWYQNEIFFSNRVPHPITSTSLWFCRKLVFWSDYSIDTLFSPMGFLLLSTLILFSSSYFYLALQHFMLFCFYITYYCTSLCTVIRLGASYCLACSVWQLQCHLKLWARRKSDCWKGMQHFTSLWKEKLLKIMRISLFTKSLNL